MPRVRVVTKAIPGSPGRRGISTPRSGRCGCAGLATAVAILMHMTRVMRMPMFVKTCHRCLRRAHGGHLARSARRLLDDGAHRRKAPSAAWLAAKAAVHGTRRPWTFLAVDGSLYARIRNGIAGTNDHLIQLKARTSGRCICLPSGNGDERTPVQEKGRNFIAVKKNATPRRSSV